MSTAPKAALFDLDDTLTESFQPPTPQMIELLGRLLAKMPVGIVSAANWPRIQQQLLAPLTESKVPIERLYIQPNSSAECYTYETGGWEQVYNFDLNDDEQARIKKAVEEATAEVDIRHPGYEPVIVERPAQISYAAVGLNAPFEVKQQLDPDQSKRNKLKEAIERRVPDVDVRIGGRTNIDITKKGVNKACGVDWLAKHLDIPASEMLFVGDALYPGGNDEVVIPTGVQTRQTSGPAETETIIRELLS